MRQTLADLNVVFTVGYMTGSFGIIMWLATIRGAARRMRWPRHVGGFLCLAASGSSRLCGHLWPSSLH